MASTLCAEANKIRKLYADLWQVYEVDMELTKTMEDMARELELDGQ